MLISKDCIFHKYYKVYQARLVQSVEHETLNLRVMGSSPTLGATSFLLPNVQILDQVKSQFLLEK